MENGSSHRLSSGRPPSGTPKETSGNNLSFVITFILMMLTWILLSGKFDPFHLGLGVVSSLLVAYFSRDLLFTSPIKKDILNVWLRFAGYIPWLLYQIFLSNLHLMYLAFHPGMRNLIDPKLTRFRSRMTSETGLVTFANSITLTPGTITAYVSALGYFTIHSIDGHSRDPLPGEMEERIAHIFGEQ